MQTAPSDPTSDPIAPGGGGQRFGDAIGLIHFLVKEVEWIRMLSSRMCRGRREPERAAEDIESIRELSASVAHRMRSFLDEARRAGSRTADVVEIECLVDRAIRQVTRRGVAPSLSLYVDEDVRGVTVSSELLVAVVAVVENAIESTGNGGKVAVRVGFDGNDLVISIEDSGIGMDEAVLCACRAPGFTTRLASGGQGFGLYSASRILTRIRGDLHLESEPGAGTRVLMTVPPSPAPTPAPPAPPATGRAPRRRLPGSTW